MKKLALDWGVEEYRLGSGVLRLNPGDPNLYTRFLEAAEKIPSIERELVEQAKEMEDGEGTQALLSLLYQADRRMKHLLAEVFQGNDFEKLLQGVNLLSVGNNGERVITNLLHTLEPVLRAGAERFAEAQTAQAVEKAKARRVGA